MYFLFVFIWCCMVSGSFTKSGVPQAICSFRGARGNSSYVLSVSDIPERCEVIAFGWSAFNITPDAADTTAVQTLKSANKTVYKGFTFEDGVYWFETIMPSPDPKVLDDYIAPMIKYLSENKIDGVLLGWLSFSSSELPDYATKINTLISRVKTCLPSIKVALFIGLSPVVSFSDKSIFDYSVVDSLTDMYIMDTPTGWDGCVFPTKSLEELCVNVKSSPMSKTKLVINFMDQPLDGNGDIIPFSEYCTRPADSGTWCASSIETFYDQAKYAKDYFSGIMISDLDFDDYKETCGCGKFPVANAYMDGWFGSQIKCCDKIA